MDLSEIKYNVICITTPEKSVNYKWENNSEKIQGVEVISINDITSLPDQIRRKYFLNAPIFVGMVYIRDPYTGVYYPASDAHDKLCESKYGEIRKVAMYLGAKKISREVEFEETISREISASGDIEYKAVKMDASYEQKRADLNRRYNREENIYDGNSTQMGYDIALAYCQNTGLIYDPSFKSLLESRAPNNPNKQRIFSVITEISSECNSSMDAAFSLNVLAGVFKLNARCSEAIKTTATIKIKSIIEY